MNTSTEQQLDAVLAKLPREIVPEHDLWPSIAARIATHENRVSVRGNWSYVAAVAVVALVMLSLAWIMPGFLSVTPSDTAHVSTPSLTRLTLQTGASQRAIFMAQLASDNGLPLKSRRALLDNLHLLQDSIQRTEAAVKKYPRDINLRTLLFNLYQQQARLINAAQRAQIQTTVRNML